MTLLRKVIKYAKKKCKKLLCKVANKAKFITSEQMGPPAGWVLSTIHWSERYPHANCSVIRKPSRVNRKKPTRIGGQPHNDFETKEQTAPTFLAEIPGARVWRGREIAVIAPDDRLLKDLSKTWGKPPSSHEVFSTLKLGDVRNIEGEYLLLATTSGKGYFHWMMDVLPRIKIANKKYNIKEFDGIITNEISKKFQKETLKMTGIDTKKIIQLKKNEQIKCEKMFAPSLPRENARTQEWAVNYVNKIIKKDKEETSAERIYLSREDAESRKVLNERKLVNVIRKFGFEKVKMSEYSVAEQAKKVSNSKYIIAPHGASLTNIVFCENGKSILEIFPESYIVPCYWQIASIKNIKYAYMCGNECNSGKNNFVVDIGKVKKWLKETVEE